MGFFDAFTLKALIRAPKISDILAENEAKEKAGLQLKRSLTVFDLLGYGGEI